METTTAAEADADAVPVGDVDDLNRQPRSPRSTDGPNVTSITVAKNAHILLVNKNKKSPSPT